MFFSSLCLGGCEQPPPPNGDHRGKAAGPVLPAGEHHKPGCSSSQMEEEEWFSSECPHAPGAEGVPGPGRLCQRSTEGWRRYLSGRV